MKLESWEREPLWLKLITPYLKKKRFPELVEEPETEKWHRIYLDGCVSADGEETYADFQLGSENKLLVFFMGGGVSWNEYTAARPVSVYSKNIHEGFYMIHTDLFTDLNLNKGIFEKSDRNPFNNWSKLVLVYNTGDFHAGNGDFEYTALDGTRRLCHHHGYRNYRKAMDKVKELIDAPEALVVSGCSGGAFGAALLCDDIMGIYPGCENVNCLVDSGFFLMDNWHDIAQNIWHSPKEITERLISDNILLDTLRALYKKHGDKVKILFTCSKRDGSLARMTNYIQKGELAFSREGGDLIQGQLEEMCRNLKKYIPPAGIYIFDIPDKRQKANALSIHCIIGEKVFYEYETEGCSCMEWVNDAVNDSVNSYGIKPLKN